MVRRIRADRVAAACARRGRRCLRACAVDAAFARRPPACARYAGVHQRPGGVESHARHRQADGPLRELATFWLLNRMSDDWADFGLRPALKTAGIYDPDAITLRKWSSRSRRRICRSSPSRRSPLTGDAARGKNASTRCLMCHAIGGTGADFGPALDGWGRGKSAEVDRHRHRQAQRRDRAWL